MSFFATLFRLYPGASQQGEMVKQNPSDLSHKRKHQLKLIKNLEKVKKL